MNIFKKIKKSRNGDYCYNEDRGNDNHDNDNKQSIRYIHLMMNSFGKTSITLEIDDEEFTLSFYEKILGKPEYRYCICGYHKTSGNGYHLLLPQSIDNKMDGLKDLTESDFNELGIMIELIELTNRQIPFCEDDITNYLSKHCGFFNNKYSSFDAIMLVSLPGQFHSIYTPHTRQMSNFDNFDGSSKIYEGISNEIVVRLVTILKKLDTKKFCRK